MVFDALSRKLSPRSLLVKPNLFILFKRRKATGCRLLVSCLLRVSLVFDPKSTNFYSRGVLLILSVQMKFPHNLHEDFPTTLHVDHFPTTLHVDDFPTALQFCGVILLQHPTFGTCSGMISNQSTLRPTKKFLRLAPVGALG